MNRLDVKKFYFLKLKKIPSGTFCRYDILKIEAFIETTRDNIIFDILEKILEYILPRKRGNPCFSHLDLFDCLNFKVIDIKRVFLVSEVEMLSQEIRFKKYDGEIFRVISMRQEKYRGSRATIMRATSQTRGRDIVLRENCSNLSLSTIILKKFTNEIECSIYSFRLHKIYIKFYGYRKIDFSFHQT